MEVEVEKAMLSEEVLARPAKVLSQEQRQGYFRDGYVCVEDFISEEWLDRLWQVTNDFIEKSRAVAAPDEFFDIEPDHNATNPRLRRINHPVENHPVYREFALNGPIVDIAEDLLGADVKFHHSKLNLKWAGGGEEVKWHQDIQFYPHTNYSDLAIGLYLHDVDDEMGPLGVIPGSHRGELFDLYDENEQWTGAVRDADMSRVALDKAVWLTGKRGSVTVHNCRLVHGSTENRSPRMRPLLLNAFSAADSMPVTNLLDSTTHSGAIVRGQPAKWMRFDPEPCLIPPDWSAGYTSIFSLQQEEDGANTLLSA